MSIMAIKSLYLYLPTGQMFLPGQGMPTHTGMSFQGTSLRGESKTPEQQAYAVSACWLCLYTPKEGVFQGDSSTDPRHRVRVEQFLQ